MTHNATRFPDLQTMLIGLDNSGKRKRVWSLRVEREILIAEIKQARRLHSPVSTLEVELQAVVTELLSIG